MSSSNQLVPQERTHLPGPVGPLCRERPSCLPLSFSLSHTPKKKMCFSSSRLHSASPQHPSASEAHLPSEPWEGKLRPGHHSSQGCLPGCLGLRYKTGTFLDSEAVFLPSRRLGKERAGAGQRAQLALKKPPCPCEAAWHSRSAPEEGDLFTMHPT